MEINYFWRGRQQIRNDNDEAAHPQFRSRSGLAMPNSSNCVLIFLNVKCTLPSVHYLRVQVVESLKWFCRPWISPIDFFFSSQKTWGYLITKSECRRHWIDRNFRIYLQFNDFNNNLRKLPNKRVKILKNNALCTTRRTILCTKCNIIYYNNDKNYCKNEIFFWKFCQIY